MKKKKKPGILSMSAMSDPTYSTYRLEFICRGCSMYDRAERCGSFTSSIRDDDDNSYLIFVEEPKNEYDPNAVRILSRGEIFGTVGYVGREFTLKVKDVLNKCSCYRIDMINRKDIGKREIPLILSWHTEEADEVQKNSSKTLKSTFDLQDG